MKRITLLALAAGLVFLTGLVAWSGLDGVGEAVMSAGWGVALVVLARIVALAVAGLGWWTLFPARMRPTLLACIGLRHVREGVNTLLPVAQVGGDLVGARLATQREVPGSLAGASVIVDVMAQALTQFLFTLCGLAALLALGGDQTVVPYVEVGLCIAAPALIAFYVVQRRGGHRLLQAVLSRFAGEREWRVFGAVDVLYAQLRTIYANRGRLLGSLAIHSVGWVVGIAEVWIALRFMGHEVGFLEALVIESLAQAVRGAAFAVPGAIGAQEGGLIALCAVFGIPAEVALALSLVKRVADLGVGIPGVIAWQALEGRSFLSRRRTVAAGLGDSLRGVLRATPSLGEPDRAHSA